MIMPKDKNIIQEYVVGNKKKQIDNDLCIVSFGAIRADLAKYIVRLHNKELERREEKKRRKEKKRR